MAQAGGLHYVPSLHNSLADWTPVFWASFGKDERLQKELLVWVPPTQNQPSETSTSLSAGQISTASPKRFAATPTPSLQNVNESWRCRLPYHSVRAVGWDDALHDLVIDSCLLVYNKLSLLFYQGFLLRPANESDRLRFYFF